ncbi:MAG: ribonuclease Z [Clostridia bacterium]|nr:ribonuclease Z [Clostridia bacterium]
MHLIVCIDDRGGMSFFGKRQSMDSAVRTDILKTAEGEIFMTAYSARQFDDCGRIKICDDSIGEIGEGDTLFLETVDPRPFLDGAKKITLYRWNRTYPFDMAFPLQELESRRKKIRFSDFSGSSHDKITKEEWV